MCGEVAEVMGATSNKNKFHVVKAAVTTNVYTMLPAAHGDNAAESGGKLCKKSDAASRSDCLSRPW